MKLALGTVQFGMPYGISNTQGQTPFVEVENIIQHALLHHINTFDTAPSYGNSEQILGQLFKQPITNQPLQIITKTPHFTSSSITDSDIQLLHNTLQLSLVHLQQHTLYALLIHNADNLLQIGAERLYQALITLKQQGIIQKIGVSIYTPQQLDQILPHFPVDIVQLPFNLFDQRWLHQGYLETLQQKGIEIHARSIFLQGLLLMPKEQLPKSLEQYYPHFQSYYQFLSEHQLTPLQACLGYALCIPYLDKILCGVTQKAQLQALLSISPLTDIQNIQHLAIYNEKLINPSLW